MNDTWKIIFENRIKEYEAIHTLEVAGLFDEEEAMMYKANLLKEIIGDFRSEVDE